MAMGQDLNINIYVKIDDNHQSIYLSMKDQNSKSQLQSLLCLKLQLIFHLSK